MSIEYSFYIVLIVFSSYIGYLWAADDEYDDE